MKRLDVKQHTVFRFIHQLNLCFLVVSSSFHIAFACLWECFKRARCMYVYVCVCWCFPLEYWSISVYEYCHAVLFNSLDGCCCCCCCWTERVFLGTGGTVRRSAHHFHSIGVRDRIVLYSVSRILVPIDTIFLRPSAVFSTIVQLVHIASERLQVIHNHNDRFKCSFTFTILWIVNYVL